MLRTAMARGWQPQPGEASRACLATLLRVLMTGMLSVALLLRERERERGAGRLRTGRHSLLKSSGHDCI